MSLKAISRWEQLNPCALCWTFRIASADDMRKLGTAFARAVLPHQSDRQSAAPCEKEILRIGLDSNGESGLGKTTFAEAMLSAIDQISCVESPHPSEPHGMQGIWHSPKAGWIYLYDCYSGFSEHLISRLKYHRPKIGLPCTVIVEHPYADDDKEFDCLLFLKSDSDGVRRITFAVTANLAGSEGFQKFLDKHSHWMVKPANDNKLTLSKPGAKELFVPS